MDALVSTVGTSLLTNCMRTATDVFSATDNALIMSNFNAVQSIPELDELLGRVQAYLMVNPAAYINTAELNTIRKYAHRMTGTASVKVPDTDYVFLATHTVLGSFCAGQLTQYVRTEVVDIDVIVKHIDQFQVDATDALDTGWRNLCELLDDIHRTYRADVLYNVTGGYKLLTGLTQSYASNRGSRVMYTFEGDSPLVIIDVNATGVHPEITFYQDR